MARDPDLSHIVVRDAYLERFPHTCFGLGEWRRYTVGTWPTIHEQQVRRELQAIAEGAARNGLGVQINHNLINSIFHLVKAHRFVPDTAFDANTEVLAFDDCALHFATRRQLPHNPQNYFTSKLPFAYDPTARSPVWEKFLADTVPECTDFLQEFAYYCLTTSTEHEIALWLCGPAGGGKSTFIEALTAMLGSRACVLGLNEIARSRFALTSLPGKTLAISTEQPADYISAAHTINSLISGERISVDRKMRDPIEVIPHAKFIWAMNELPRVGNHGLFRRIKVVHFPGIPVELRNPRIKEAVAQAGMAVTNWALDGGVRFVERGRFIIPAAVDEASEEYRLSNDIPQLFLDECCEVGVSDKTSAADLYAAYSKWCKVNGHYRESSTKFGIDMERLGITKQKSSIIYRLGVRVKADWEDRADEILGEYGESET